MSSADAKNHWQRLMEQLGLVEPETPADSVEARGPVPQEQNKAGEAQREPIAAPGVPSETRPETDSQPMDHFGSGPTREIASQRLPTSAPAEPAATKSLSRLLGRSLAGELAYSHWGKIAQSLGLQLSVDVPVVPSQPSPGTGQREPVVHEESRDVWAYEIPPVEPTAAADVMSGDWQEHRGEFDVPDEVDTSGPIEVPVSLEAPSSSPDEVVSEPRRGRRRRGRRRRRLASAGGPPKMEVDRMDRDTEPELTASEVASSETTDEFEAEAVGDEKATAQHLSRFKHVKIPTWEQAVGFIIEQNLAQRARGSSDSRRGRTNRR